MKWRRLFDPENLFFRELSLLVDVVGLSLLWLLLCLPLVTIGPATAALYHTAVKGLRGGDSATFRRFFRSFRENLRQGIPLTLVFLLVVLLMKLGLDVMAAQAKSSLGMGMLVVYMVALLLPTGYLSWLFPLMGRFTFPTKQLFPTALRLLLAHFPATLLVAVIHAASLFLMRLLVWPVIFLPMLATLLVSVPMEKIFHRYMKEKEENLSPEEKGHR